MRPSFSAADRNLDPVLSLVRWFLAAIATAFWGTLSLLLSVFDSTGRSAHFCMRTWARWCLWISGSKLEISGLELVREKKAYIVVSNHQGQIDILILSAILPFQFVWVSKKENFRIPFLGWHMKRAGYVSVDRQNKEQAIASMGVAAHRLREGKSIAFFPEGTRSRDGNLLPFKMGAFHLAMETGVTVLPVVIDGSVHVLPKGSMRIRPSVISVTILPPIIPTVYSIEEKYDFRDMVRNIMIEVLKTNFDPPGEVRYS